MSTVCQIPCEWLEHGGATDRTHLIKEPSALTVNVMFSRKFDRTRSHCTGSGDVTSVNHSLLQGPSGRSLTARTVVMIGCVFLPSGTARIR